MLSSHGDFNSVCVDIATAESYTLTHTRAGERTNLLVFPKGLKLNQGEGGREGRIGQRR